MRLSRNTRVLLLTALSLMAMPLVAACGSDSASSTATAVSATALRREQAIATFTAEAISASPTPTPFPARAPSQPTETSAPVVTETPTPRPVPTQAPRVLTEQQEEDRYALQELLRVRARAMVSSDFETWYGTCAPSIRERARETDALGKQLRSLRLDLGEDSAVEFVVEQVLFTGDTAATVVWGWRDGAFYLPGIGAGPYIKEDGEWFSLGWGCAG